MFLGGGYDTLALDLFNRRQNHREMQPPSLPGRLRHAKSHTSSLARCSNTSSLPYTEHYHTAPSHRTDAEGKPYVLRLIPFDSRPSGPSPGIRPHGLLLLLLLPVVAAAMRGLRNQLAVGRADGQGGHWLRSPPPLECCTLIWRSPWPTAGPGQESVQSPTTPTNMVRGCLVFGRARVCLPYGRVSLLFGSLVIKISTFAQVARSPSKDRRVRPSLLFARPSGLVYTCCSRGSEGPITFASSPTSFRVSRSVSSPTIYVVYADLPVAQTNTYDLPVAQTTS